MGEHYHYRWYLEETNTVWRKPSEYKNISSSQTKN